VIKYSGISDQMPTGIGDQVLRNTQNDTKSDNSYKPFFMNASQSSIKPISLKYEIKDKILDLLNEIFQKMLPA